MTNIVDGRVAVIAVTVCPRVDVGSTPDQVAIALFVVAEMTARRAATMSSASKLKSDSDTTAPVVTLAVLVASGSARYVVILSS